MTAREEIKKYLTSRHGYVLSSELHNHIVSLGYNRKSSCGTLSKMLSRGEVISIGHHHSTSVKLNPSYCATKSSVRQTVNHRHLGKPKGRVPAKPKTRSNAIFDLCRQYSTLYQMDKLLREVRP